MRNLLYFIISVGPKCKTVCFKNVFVRTCKAKYGLSRGILNDGKFFLKIKERIELKF